MTFNIYAVNHGGRWYWKLSLCPGEDQVYWLGEQQAAAIVWIEQGLAIDRAELRLKEAERWSRKLSELGVAAYWRRCRQRWRNAQLQHTSAETQARLTENQSRAVREEHLPALYREIRENRWEGVSGRLLRLDELRYGLESQKQEVTFWRQEGLWKRFLQRAYLTGRLTYHAGMAWTRPAARFRRFRRPSWRCRRCGSGGALLQRSECLTCGDSCLYCNACLSMGKIRRCTILVHIKSAKDVIEAGNSRQSHHGSNDVAEPEQSWQLSQAQAAAAEKALRFIRQQRARPCGFLIWAVTGAGKTEMIFPLIADILRRCLRVAIASPRKDVILELAPRLAKAFPDTLLAVLHGESDQKWSSSPLVLATTHQLLRFRRCFDLVIVDEIDAFPFHGNPMLQYAAYQACRLQGSFVFLTATPARAIERAVQRGKQAVAMVPARFHGHPLPLPQLKLKRTLSGRFEQLLAQLKESTQVGAQCFVFVASIELGKRLCRALQKQLPGIAVEATSSTDARRTEKVSAFRDRRIRVLVTTTILERGVTIEQADVFVFDADAGLYDRAALIQMAGRAGRSVRYPTGKVCFFARHKTKSQTAAVKSIRSMNRLARKRGYLKKLLKKE